MNQVTPLRGVPPEIGTTSNYERVTVSYDAAGRHTSSSEYCSDISNSGTSTPVVRTYDADNHTLTDNCSGYDPSGTVCTANAESNESFTWDPAGHLSQITEYLPGGPNETYTLHWDGNTLLFVSDSSGNLVQLNIEKLAMYTSSANTLTVIDRDFAGQQVSAHQADAGDVWMVAPNAFVPGKWVSVPKVISQFPGYGSYQSGDTTDSTGKVTQMAVFGQVVGIGRLDGYQSGDLIFQGVRAYDPSMQQWTSPDAYAGDVQDPMSQRPYMWNRNNPLAYSDPSGYHIIIMYARSVGGVASEYAHFFIEVHNDKGQVIARYSFGPSGSCPWHCGKLISEGPGYDRPHVDGIDTFGRTIIGGCKKGVCTMNNGGFNEKGLAATAKQINALRLNYKITGPNSASAAYTMCKVNGGKGCGSTNTGGHPAPGDGQNLLPNAH